MIRNDIKIACEISITNTPEYEVQNIQKCLRSGYPIVFMISNDQKHLNKIHNLAHSLIEPSLHNRLYFVSKGDFVNQLDLLLTQFAQSDETRARGYRVKVNYFESSNKCSMEKTLKDVVLSSLRRKDKPDFEI